ncbi:HAD family hydrolase [Desertibacillus haloalkaliphilus]|uniref:HAD family hydrolase n=1 Tax=Desertibacillus haloalkaliphilus TaxID=1328930 RepID=UPI001C272EB2|nr:HAD family hydrolase [Desertibacillus haloalkaliphilus]MBU8905728.1 HAD family hydrolase [Desertibacillus haloalkaliphilus]
MMRWNTICFDLDNTLFSHEHAFEQAITHCYYQFVQQWLDEGRCRLQPDAADWFRIFKRNSDLYWSSYEDGQIGEKTYRRLRYHDTVRALNLPYTDREADRFHQYYDAVVADFSEPFPGLQRFIKALVHARVNVGIITNGSMAKQLRKIDKLGIRSIIPDDSIIISEAVHAAKPSKAIFDVAKMRLCTSEAEVPLYIGDSWQQDVVGALDANWDAIYLNTRFEKPNTAHEPVCIFESFTDVIEFIYDQNKLKG